MRDTFLNDPYTTVVGMLDDGFMLFYSHVRRNARRITNLIVTLVPLMALLVGSCKTSQTASHIYSVVTSAEKFQSALFPDRAHFQGARYVPAAGYVSQARDYVESKPQSLTMLGRNEIGYIFGKPSFQRHDADAEVWQYKTSSCVVDIYFYGDKHASYIEARRKGHLPVAADDKSSCLRNIKKTDFDSADI